MLKIGFVDHHLNNYHANKFLSLIHGPLADQDCRVVLAWESDPAGDEDWCAKNQVRKASSAADVAKDCDAVFVLAPDNVDAHLALCQAVFPAGKPTVVDKFLAPDLRSAKAIVSLAEKHDVKLSSASGLRFAVEVEEVLPSLGEKPVDAYARGMGGWDLYGVHTLSMVLAGMGSAVARLVDTGTADVANLTLEYEDGRRAWIDVRTAENEWDLLSWSFGFRVDGKYVGRTVKDFNGFYTNLIARQLQFFKTGVSAVSTVEMLKVPAILESATRSREQGGVWIQL